MDTLEAVTLTVAIFGAVTGAAGLSWNVAQFLLIGPRIKVTLKEARIGPGGFVTGGRAWNNTDPRWPTPMLAVEVVNKGRAAATIDTVSAGFAGGIEYRDLNDYGGVNKPLPYRIESHASATWAIELHGAHATVEASRKALGINDRRVHGVVKMATGKKFISKERLTVPT